MKFSTFVSLFHSRMTFATVGLSLIAHRVFSDFLLKGKKLSHNHAKLGKQIICMFDSPHYLCVCDTLPWGPVVSHIPSLSTLTLTKYGIYPSIHIIWTNHENIALLSPLPFPNHDQRYLPDAGRTECTSFSPEIVIPCRDKM